MDPVGPGLWIVDRLRELHQRRRRVRVLVHRACFTSGSPPQPVPPEHYFMKVTNHSENRDVGVTHAWFETNPPVHILGSTRPLPVRLRPDQTFEMWVPVDMLGRTAHAERLGRVRLSNGNVVKSRLNRAVPPVGMVAR
jgi:hypothetical protein